jgi:hypothetical protein
MWRWQGVEIPVEARLFGQVGPEEHVYLNIPISFLYFIHVLGSFCRFRPWSEVLVRAALGFVRVAIAACRPAAFHRCDCKQSH